MNEPDLFEFRNSLGNNAAPQAHLIGQGCLRDAALPTDCLQHRRQSGVTLYGHDFPSKRLQRLAATSVDNPMALPSLPRGAGVFRATIRNFSLR
jgi:hypothetical protein